MVAPRNVPSLGHNLAQADFDLDMLGKRFVLSFKLLDLVAAFFNCLLEFDPSFADRLRLVGSPFLGATAAATFMAWTGGATWPISVYLIVLAVITSIAAMAAPETAGTQLK